MGPHALPAGPGAAAAQHEQQEHGGSSAAPGLRGLDARLPAVERFIEESGQAQPSEVTGYLAGRLQAQTLPGKASGFYILARTHAPRHQT